MSSNKLFPSKLLPSQSMPCKDTRNLPTFAGDLMQLLLFLRPAGLNTYTRTHPAFYDLFPFLIPDFFYSRSIVVLNSCLGR